MCALTSHGSLSAYMNSSYDDECDGDNNYYYGKQEHYPACHAPSNDVLYWYCLGVTVGVMHRLSGRINI